MSSAGFSLGEMLREIMSNCAASVTVVTFQWDGRSGGLTVSAFTSVSLRPPLVLVCIGGEAGSADMIRRAGGFTVNLLRQGSAPVARRFSSPEEDRFAGLAQRAPTVPGAGPLLPDHAFACLECRVTDFLEAGDHVVFIGQVENAVQLSDHPPLAYWRRSYARPALD